MKKASIVILFLLAGAVFTLGCTQPGGMDEKASMVTITDSAGRKVTIDQPVERIVTLSSDSAEAVRALGAGDRIVGISKYMKDDPYWGEIGEKQVVGSCFSPNYEKMAELNPDVVITYTKWSEDLQEKLKPFNITVVRLDFYKSRTLCSEIEKLGVVLGREEQAHELIDFYDENDNRITRKVQEIPSEDRVRVYVEGYQAYDSAGEGSGWHQQVTLAGGRNIAADLGGAYPEVSAEWVVEQNPDVIVKAVSGSGDAFGYTVNETNKARAIKEEIAGRPGWSTIKAVRDDRIYLVSGDVFSGLRYPVGTAYLAKQFYPQKFQDLNPREVHREYLERFQGVECKGLWYYPPVE